MNRCWAAKFLINLHLHSLIGTCATFWSKAWIFANCTVVFCRGSCNTWSCVYFQSGSEWLSGSQYISPDNIRTQLGPYYFSKLRPDPDFRCKVPGSSKPVSHRSTGAKSNGFEKLGPLHLKSGWDLNLDNTSPKQLVYMVSLPYWCGKI